MALPYEWRKHPAKWDGRGHPGGIPQSASNIAVSKR